MPARPADADDTESGTVVPRPDPTLLTTQQLLREMGALREVIGLTEQALHARMEAMDKAIVLLQTIIDRLPRMMEEKIDALQRVHEEKFKSIGTQFQERDTRTDKMAEATSTAIAAALQAAKEAVGAQNTSSAAAITKSEMATDKRIEQLGTLIAAGAKTSDEKIGDIKDRLTRIEGNQAGVRDQKTEGQAGSNQAVGIAAIVISAVAVIATIVIALTSHR